MEFGYFTLSDNHYLDNPRGAEPLRRRHRRRGALRRRARAAFGLDRRAPFHPPRRAVLPRPGARLCRGAHQAHPPGAGGHRAAAASSDPRRRAMGDARPALSGGRVDFAAGRGYDRREYEPFGVSFDDNQAVFDEGMEMVRRLWERGRADLASRQVLSVRRCRHHAEAGAAADAGLCRVVLAAVDRARREARLRPHRRAVRRGDDLRRPAAGGRSLSRDLRQARHRSRAG